MAYDVSLIDVCLPCYLTDHHNREGEQLLCVAVDGGTRNGAVLAELRSELQNYEYPDGFNYRAAELAIEDCMKGADLRRLFDSSLDRSSSDDDESSYAYFLLSYSIDPDEPAPLNLDDMTTDPAELFKFWNHFQTKSRNRAAELFPDRPAGFVRAARDLANYASNKGTAMQCRARGDLETAIEYESICQRIYDGLPAFARW